MPLRSLRARLVLLFFASLTLAAILFAIVAAHQFNGYERSQSTAALRKQAKYFARYFARKEQHDLGALPDPHQKPVSITQDLQAATGADIFLARRNKLPFGTTRSNLTPLPAPYARELRWTLLERGGIQTFDMVIDGRHYLAAAAPTFFTVPGPTKPHKVAVGALVMARQRRSLSASALAQTERLVPSFLIAVAVALLLALFLGRRITRPVRELSAASELIAAGIYDLRLRSKGGDELGRLAARFELMAARLKESDQHERNFLMRISHELRTPLTAIQGHVQALADDIVEDPEERAASLAVVLTEAERLQRLIGDLLDLAKLEARRFSLNRELVDVDALCTLAVQARREQARSRDVALCLASDGPQVVEGDGDRILQIVGNLIDNALRWTPAGGEVAVGVTRGLSSASITVADTGPGVPPEERQAIFRPFVSHHDLGTGLGLSVAAELASAMGGSLEVGDRPGGGALFTLHLPLAGAAQAGSRDPRRRSATPA